MVMHRYIVWPVTFFRIKYSKKKPTTELSLFTEILFPRVSATLYVMDLTMQTLQNL